MTITEAKKRIERANDDVDALSGSDVLATLLAAQADGADAGFTGDLFGDFSGAGLGLMHNEDAFRVLAAA